MKKLIILLSALMPLFSAGAYESKPLVEPGKTWWYGEAHPTQNAEHKLEKSSLGIRICGMENINGYEWYTCHFVEPDNRGEVVDGNIGYLRQCGAKVYFYPALDKGNLSFENDLFSFILSEVYQVGFEPGDIPDEGVLLYDMEADAGDELDCFGIVNAGYTDKHESVRNFVPYTYNIERVEFKSRCGIERKILHGSMNIKIIQQPVHGFCFIDGIGVISSVKDGLFFVPYVLHMADACLFWLQGVVDSEENLLWVADESITEPWKPAGISDATADTTEWSYSCGTLIVSVDATVRVFDVSGRIVVAPVSLPAGGSLRLDLPAGLYVVDVATSSARTSARIALP